MADEVARYREHLAGLEYPEYALSHAHGAAAGQNVAVLDLSLWNDELPPGVMEVAARALPTAVGAYALAQDPDLVTSLSERSGVASESIVITAGADDALRVVAKYCIRPGVKTLIPQPSFGRYTYHAMIEQADVRYLPFATYPYEFSADAIAEAAREQQIDCLFIASPNNPTGHALGTELIEQLLNTVSCSVILDESLLLPGDASSVQLVGRYPNLFVCGSFSKIYGLAGLRVGYLVANQAHTGLLKKLVSPFGVDSFSLEVAKHMIAQDAWLRNRTAEIKGGIRVLQEADTLPFRLTHTSAPVALIEYMGAESLYRTLQGQGVATVAGEEFPGLGDINAVRVIIRSMEDMLELKRILANIS